MQPRSSWRFAALVLVSLCATASTPFPSYSPQDKEKTSQGFVLEAGEHQLGEIIRKAGKFLGRNYFMPRAEMENMQNSIEIQKKLNLDAIGCEEVVSQLAYLKGFAIVPIDSNRGMYDVISMRGQRVQEIAIGAAQLSPDEVLRKAHHRIMVLTTVTMKHIDANKASQQLRPFFTSGGGRNGLQFGNPGNSGSLLLQGFAPQVAAAIRLLREVDQPEQRTLPESWYEQVQALRRLTNQQANSIKAMQKRLTDLEAQLAALGGSAKKK